MADLTVLFDIKNPHSYLALQPTLAMVDGAGGRVDWQPLVTPPLVAPVVPGADADRGALHRWHRARYRIMDLRRYAAARNLPDACFADERLFSGSEARVAAAAWWQHREHPRSVDLLVALHDRYWQEGLNPDDATQVAAVLAEVLGDDGASAGTLDDALAALEEHQQALRDAGFFDVPGYVIGDEVFYGRQHLPMVRWQLEGAEGPAPAWGRGP